jgi:hypothetical protein
MADKNDGHTALVVLGVTGVGLLALIAFLMSRPANAADYAPLYTPTCEELGYP